MKEVFTPYVGYIPISDKILNVGCNIFGAERQKHKTAAAEKRNERGGEILNA